MARIELDRQTHQALARMLVRHLKDELDVEVDPTDGSALLDYLAEALGPHFYNQGLRDAQAAVQARTDAIVEAIDGLEKPVRR